MRTKFRHEGRGERERGSNVHPGVHNRLCRAAISVRLTVHEQGNSQRGSRRVQQQRWEPLSAIHLSSHYRVPNKLYLHASEQASNSANIPLHLGVTGCKTQGASVVFRGKPVAGRVRDHILCAFFILNVDVDVDGHFHGCPWTCPWVRP